MQISLHKSSPMHFFEETSIKVRRSLGRIFSTLTAIQKDNNASIQLLKIGRYAIFVFRVYHGKIPDASLIYRDFDRAINVLEGLQFIAAISSLIPKKEDKNVANEPVKTPLLERITDAGFKISDCLSGVLWCLSKGVRILGAFSGNIKIIESLEMLSLGAALIASLADGGTAAQMISKYWNVNTPDKTAAIWQLCERVTGVSSMALILVALIFSGAGSVLIPVTVGLATASAFCGLIRFACDLDYSEEIKQT